MRDKRYTRVLRDERSDGPSAAHIPDHVLDHAQIEKVVKTVVLALKVGSFFMDAIDRAGKSLDCLTPHND